MNGNGSHRPERPRTTASPKRASTESRKQKSDGDGTPPPGESEQNGAEKPEKDPAATLIEEFNEKYFVVAEAGKALIYAERFDADLRRRSFDRITFQDFTRPTKTAKSRSARTRTKNLLRKRSRASGWIARCADNTWTAWCSTHQGKRAAVLKPLARVRLRTVSAGSWSLMRIIILNVVCRGNHTHYDYFERWLARLVQRPWRLGEVAIVLRGIESAGKGILARAIKHICGQHGIQVHNAKHLTGSFNMHLRDCVFVFADEAIYARDAARVGTLNALITEPRIMIEGKGMNALQAENRLHVMMASNADWVIPASTNARRYFVLDVSKERVGDHGYFAAINEQMEMRWPGSHARPPVPPSI